MAVPQQLTPEDALRLYKNTLNFNVVARYDPAVKQLLYTTSHCVVYKFDDQTQEWLKKDFQGAMMLYLREFSSPPNNRPLGEQDLQSLFCYGLILLNRASPENFSAGLVPNAVTRQYFPNGVLNNGIKQMDVEMNDNLIIIRNLLGDIYGLWVFDEEDRAKLFKLVSFCLNKASL